MHEAPLRRPARRLARAAWLCACLAFGCTGLEEEPDRADPFPDFDTPEKEERERRQWFSSSVFVTDRGSQDQDGIDDGIGMTLGGGYDLVGDPLRFAFEGEIGWSGHDTNWQPLDPQDSDNVTLFLVSMGGRLWLRPNERQPISPYLRAGGFGRFLVTFYGLEDEEYLNKPADFDESILGVYWGAGLQVRFAPGAEFGPYFLRLHPTDGSDGDEVLIGLGAQFGF